MSTTVTTPAATPGRSETAPQGARDGAPGLTGHPSATLPPAAAPVGPPAAALVSVVLCVALVALGVVALREVLVGREVAGQVLVPGQGWLGPALSSATALVPGTTAVLVGAGGLVLGLLLLLAALRRRPARSVRLVDPIGTGVPLDLEPGSVADLAAETALGDGEVVASRARADRRGVTVRVTVDPRDPHDARALASATTGRVTRRLDDLRPAPRVRTQVHGVRS